MLTTIRVRSRLTRFARQSRRPVMTRLYEKEGSKLAELILHLLGLSNPADAVKVERALRKVKDVENATVSFADGRGQVQGSASFDDLRNAVIDAGFDAEP